MSKPIIPMVTSFSEVGHYRALLNCQPYNGSYVSFCTNVQPSIVDQTRWVVLTLYMTNSAGDPVADTIITVQGNFSALYPPERVTVSLSLHHDAAERGPAFSATVASSNEVHNSINRLVDVDAAAIVRWSSDSVQVWSERPWTSDGTLTAEVFHARATVSVTFGTIASLAPWIEEVVALSGVNVDALEWALTPARLTATTTEVRSRAVQDAVTKATVYAQALGLATVRAIAVADPGMLGDQVQGSAPVAAKFSRMATSTEGAPALSLTPEQIEVTAAVDARFVAL
jgi:uncharacterized protein YggE